MPTVHFRGRVLPLSRKISFGLLPQIEWGEAATGVERTFRITIWENVVHVECEMNQYTESDLGHIYARAHDLARSAVDLLAFRTGFGMTLVIETYTDPQGASSPIAPHDPELGKLTSVFEKHDFHSLWSLVATEPSLFFALNDLIVAIMTPNHVPVNCARAIEGLRHLIAPPPLSSSQSWKAMQEALRVTESYLRLITDTSVQPRHGNRKRIEGPTTSEIARRSWIIMNRFLEYRKRGNQPLPETEFPWLNS